jgi:hypothetical protein
MADARTYKWSAVYQDAVLANGTGPAGSLIAEALSAIRARLESGTPIDDAEYGDIRDAVLVLQALQAELSPS